MNTTMIYLQNIFAKYIMQNADLTKKSGTL